MAFYQSVQRRANIFRRICLAVSFSQTFQQRAKIRKNTLNDIIDHRKNYAREREREREKNTERNLYKRHVNPIPVLECYPAQSRDQLRATKVHLSKVYDFSQRVGLSIISISILAAADAAKRATATSSSLLRFSSRLPLRL
jgi:hypothetical protein